MKQGPVTLIMIGVLALVVSLISSNKIVKEQTFKAKRQALSIQNSQPKQNYVIFDLIILFLIFTLNRLM